MKKKIFLIFLFVINIHSTGFADITDCKDLKKFSVEYFKCKGNLVKEKAVSTGQDIIKDTKDYKNNKWSEEKEKMDKTKNTINKAKKKVLNK